MQRAALNPSKLLNYTASFVVDLTDLCIVRRLVSSLSENVLDISRDFMLPEEAFSILFINWRTFEPNVNSMLHQNCNINKRKNCVKYENSDDITPTERSGAGPLACSAINLPFFLAATAAFPGKDRIVPLSFCRSSPLRFYYGVDPDGPALKSPVKPLIRSGKIKPVEMGYFFSFVSVVEVMENRYSKKFLLMF